MPKIADDRAELSSKRKGWIYAACVLVVLAAAACICAPLTSAEIASTAAAVNGQATAVAQALNVPTIDLLGTSLAQTANAPARTPIPSPASTEEATDEPESVTESRQWADSATASSQWDDDSGAAIQAAGAPDVTECVDQHSAWATAGRNEVATLTLDYATPVVPTQINIYQTWHPDGVSQVEVIDVNGVSHTVYTATPSQLPDDGTVPCPYILTVDIADIDVPIAQVVVTIDQSSFDSWNEIDAVELVGTS